MIRVIKTDVLWFDGRKRRTKRPGDVFEADPALEARLVAEGVAVYVEGDGAADEAEAGQAAPEAEPSEPEPIDVDGAGDDEADEADEPDIDEMTVDELRDLADELGVEIPRKARKADIVAAIEAAGDAPKLAPAEIE